MTEYKRLWLSVILMAVADYYRKGFHESARQYIFEGGAIEENGFINLCDEFDLDAIRIRATIKKSKSMAAYKKAMRESVPVT